MPSLAVLLAATLTAGLACGIHLSPALIAGAPMLVSGGLFVCMLAHAHGRITMRWTAIVIAGLAAAAQYGASAVERALHPAVRTVLEARFGGFALESAGVGRLDGPIVVEGRLRQDAIRGGDRVVLRLDVERLWLGPNPTPASGGVSVGVPGATAARRAVWWTAGRRLRAPMLLRRPATHRNVGLPDQERALALRGIALVGSIKSGALVEVTRQARWWEERAAALRARVRATASRWLVPRDPEAAAVATAILIGDRASLAPDVERLLQEAGTYHVVAISGGNVAIFVGLVLGGLGLAGWRGRGAAAVALVTILAYGLIAEGGASVTRATAIAGIYLAIRVIDLTTAPTRALLLAAAGMLLADPLSVVDVGFWLTFGASAAILLGAAVVRLPRAWWRAVLLGLLVASAAVEAVLLPVAALQFERVTVAGLILNFAAIPSMTLVQVAAMALVATDAFGVDGLASLTASLVVLGASGLLDSARLVDLAPWLTWRVPPPSLAIVVAYYVALAAWWWSARPPVDTVVRRRAARAGAGLAIALAFVIATAPQSLFRTGGDGRLHVTLIDVGQGDAILVTFPNGRTLLVDAGGLATAGAFDIGDRVVGPALRSRGLRRLDYLALTHGDPDHVGGAAALLRDFAPREVWVGVPVPRHAPTRKVREEADRVRAVWRTLQRGDRLEVGDATLRVLHPPVPDWERPRVRNDDSLVLEVRFGAVLVLLTGDISRAVERELLPVVSPAPLVVLKVPHHGSATSSSEEFLSRLRPDIALIGAGHGNQYGHPAPAVLERYREAGTQVFRTDLDGQVNLITDGTGVDAMTYSGRQWKRDQTKITTTTKE